MCDLTYDRDKPLTEKNIKVYIQRNFIRDNHDDNHYGAGLVLFIDIPGDVFTSVFIYERCRLN